MAKHNEIGKIGEDKAYKFLTDKGYSPIWRNYWEKWGEIDLIMKAADNTLVFFEVKTMLIKNKNSLKPEDNFTQQKANKVKRSCQVFAAKHPEFIDEHKGWQIDLVTIQILESGKGLIRHYKNV